MVTNSKGKEGKARDWEQPSSPAGKAALVTGQVRLFRKPDLGAHTSVALFRVRRGSRTRWRAVGQGCHEATGRSGLGPRGHILHGLISVVEDRSYRALPSDAPKGLLKMPKRPRAKLIAAQKLCGRIQAAKNMVRFNGGQPKCTTAGSSQLREPNSAGPERVLGSTFHKTWEMKNLSTCCQPQQLLWSSSGAEQGGDTRECGEKEHT